MGTQTHGVIKVVLLVVFVVLGAAEARADNLVLTSGFVQIGGVFPPGRGSFRTVIYSFAGGNVSVSGSEGDGTTQNVLSPCSFGPCPAGTLVSGDSLTELQGLASATINGVTYQFTRPFGSLFAFDTPTVPIQNLGPIVTLTTFFSMSGTLSIFDLDTQTTVFTTMVSGTGSAVLTFQQLEDGFVLTTIRYNFEPVPEPATALLLGTGIFAVAARVHQMRKQEN